MRSIREYRSKNQVGIIPTSEIPEEGLDQAAPPISIVECPKATGDRRRRGSDMGGEESADGPEAAVHEAALRIEGVVEVEQDCDRARHPETSPPSSDERRNLSSA
jgi:hypothetical protein